MKKLMLASLVVGSALAAFAVAPFGTLPDGRCAKIWRYTSPDGLVMDFTDFGGRLVRCYAPDRYGNLADVTLGWNDPCEYLKHPGFYAGSLIGRFGNRIANGTYTLDGQKVQLTINETTPVPRHCNLHSGPNGWDKEIWEAHPFKDGITFTYTDKDGSEGFPGTVKATVTYHILPKNIWAIDYELTTDKPTVVNPTSHTYWNMAGESSGNVLKQELKIFADEYTETDAGLIPTRDVPVKGTGFDFTEFHPIGYYADWMAKNKALSHTDNWYDHNFVLRGKVGELHPAVTIRDPVSGRQLEIFTTEPCLQMYGAQNMDTSIPAKAAGKTYMQYSGVALETQHAPDSPNQSRYPSTVLRPGEKFTSHTEYHFGWMK